MVRLPNPGGDTNQWGDILNDFLATEHNTDGTQKLLSQSKITNLSSDLTALADAVDDLESVNAYPALMTLDEIFVPAAGFRLPNIDDGLNQPACYQIGKELVISGYVVRNTSQVDVAMNAREYAPLGRLIGSARPATIIQEIPGTIWDYNFNNPTPSIITITGPEDSANVGTVTCVTTEAGPSYYMYINARILLPA